MAPEMELITWIAIRPDGSVLADSSDFRTEADAWRIILGWPTQYEIDDARKRGFRVEHVRLSISKAPPQ